MVAFGVLHHVLKSFLFSSLFFVCLCARFLVTGSKTNDAIVYQVRLCVMVMLGLLCCNPLVAAAEVPRAAALCDIFSSFLRACMYVFLGEASLPTSRCAKRSRR